MSCVIDIDYDYGSCSFFDEKVLLARKEHRCCECGDIINKGDKYEKVVGKWEGDFIEYKTCLVCKEIRDRIFCSFIFTALWEELSEFTNGGYDMDYNMIDGLSINAIDKIEKYFEKNWRSES